MPDRTDLFVVTDAARRWAGLLDRTTAPGATGDRLRATAEHIEAACDRLRQMERESLEWAEAFNQIADDLEDGFNVYICPRCNKRVENGFPGSVCWCQRTHPTRMQGVRA